MFKNISLKQISKIIGPIITTSDTIVQDQIVTEITTDTRTLQPGGIFLALRGENFDGHNFISTAISKGAVAVIVDSPVEVEGVIVLRVDNTLQAYQQIAHWWRSNFDIPIIGITGSVGKTTTKELIAGLLKTQGKVLKTEANYNNEIGVPKTLLGLDCSHKYGVIEMAMRAQGEIALLTQIANPTIGVITNVGTAHIERLGSEQAIAEAKCELLKEMSRDSVAILNQDNERLMKTAASLWQGKTITYGLMGGDIRGELISAELIRVDKLDLKLPLPGKHNAINYLAALAVTKALGIDIEVFAQGVTVELPEGRAKKYTLPNDVVVLDETYNASLESMIAALEMLKGTPGKRHIAVLGTMKEVGVRSPQFHHQVGAKVQELRIDRLYLLADELDTVEIAKGAQGVACECYDNHQDLISALQKDLQKGDRLLCKASHSVQLNLVVEALLKG